MAISSPFFSKTQVLGAIIGSYDDLYWDTWSRYPKLFHVIEHESEWDYLACNTCKGTKWEGMYPASSCACGKGLGQLIPSTVKRCEIALQKDIDPFVAEDNIECSTWLYLNEGTSPWGTSTTDWGSWSHWGE